MLVFPLQFGNSGINNVIFTLPPSMEVAQAKLTRAIWLKKHADLGCFSVALLLYRKSGNQIQIKCEARWPGLYSGVPRGSFRGFPPQSLGVAFGDLERLEF